AVVGAAAWAVAAPAPVPAEKAVERWEYAELTYNPGRNAGAFAAANAPVPAVPKASWVTGEEEVDAGSWEELGGKLKVAEAPKSDNPAVHKVRVLNHLGRQGWEMVSAAQPTSPLGTTVTTFVFKRRAK